MKRKNAQPSGTMTRQRASSVNAAHPWKIGQPTMTEMILYRIVGLSPRDGSVTYVTEWMDSKPEKPTHGVIEKLTGTMEVINE